MYTKKKVMQIIKYYHINMRNLREIQEEKMRSVGVGQYGVESGMPRGNKISDVVATEAMRQIENIKFWADMATDIKYLQDRWHRITDEKEAMILQLKLSGYSDSDIGELLKIDRSTVYRTLERIAERIIGYPQE